ncbi:MAG: glycosyltransferase [Candidatus Saccharibacteria bacterium]|nr:glycosyltransferase [Candidatus Saccharibacteria bacterium]
MMTTIMLELQVIGAITSLWVIIKMLAAYQLRYRIQPEPSDDLPSVSVCIPARNEMNAMTMCLERVLASDYPKLEVIVLDDDSTDNTPHMIRAFAHAGVRFVPGEPLPEGWLGKNYALQQLLNEASGRYILFLDVDTQIEPRTIRRLVRYQQRAQVAMVSVMPQRRDMHHSSVWFGSLRYFWELLLHRATTNPGASSSAWLIDRRRLSNDLGGLSPYRSSVQPERHIAQALARRSDYRFCISTPPLGVTYEKRWRSQTEASQRLLAPRLAGSWKAGTIAVGLLAALSVMAMAGVQTLPSRSCGSALLSWVVSAALLIGMTLYYRLLWRRWWWLGWLLSPYHLVQEAIIAVRSAAGYWRGTITWKGRTLDAPRK